MTTWFAALPALALASLACSTPVAPTPEADRIVASATAKMEPRSDSLVSGTVTFTERLTTIDGKPAFRLDLRYDLSGLTPGETRGFHVHDVGDCSAPDASSAGGHFNPGGHEHGAMDHPMSHAGDLGNITADGSGRAQGLVTDLTKITLQPGAAINILGRSVIVHAKVDDLTTQPTGNAGARVACGVITAD